MFFSDHEGRAVTVMVVVDFFFLVNFMEKLSLKLGLRIMANNVGNV